MPEHARRIKFRRKALRQPDEFHTLTSRAVAWLDAHRELAAGVAVAALVVAATGLGVSQYRASQAGPAGESFRPAPPTLQAGPLSPGGAALPGPGQELPPAPARAAA